MRRIPAAVALLLPLLLLAPSCASSGHGGPGSPGGRGGVGSYGDDAARAPVVVVPTFTVAPPPPAPPAEPAVEWASIVPADKPACVLIANDVELARAIPLHLDASGPFLHVDKAKVLEVRLATPRSTVRASRSDLEVTGHVKLSDVPVRLRSGALVDGYLRVNHAKLRDGDPAHLEVAVTAPWFLKPVKDPVAPVTCDEIELARETVRGDIHRGQPVGLRVGAPIAVRATPGGPVVATIALPTPDPGVVEPIVETYEVGRRGEQVRIRIEWDETDVEAWVSRRDVSPQGPTAALMGMLGAMPTGGGTIALASEAPLHVHTGGRIVRVGTARPTTFACVKPGSAGALEIELVLDGPFGGLGLGGFGSGPGSGPQPLEAKLFVAPTRGEACVETRAPGRR